MGNKSKIMGKTGFQKSFDTLDRDFPWFQVHWHSVFFSLVSGDSLGHGVPVYKM